MSFKIPTHPRVSEETKFSKHSWLRNGTLMPFWFISIKLYDNSPYSTWGDAPVVSGWALLLIQDWHLLLREQPLPENHCLSLFQLTLCIFLFFYCASLNVYLLHRVHKDTYKLQSIMKLLLLIAPLLGCLRARSVSSSFFLSMIINCNANYISDSGHSVEIIWQAFYVLLLLLITFGKMLPPFYRQIGPSLNVFFFANHRAAMYDDCLILSTAATAMTPSWSELPVSEMLWDLPLKNREELIFHPIPKKRLTEVKIDWNNTWTIGIFSVSLLVEW